MSCCRPDGLGRSRNTSRPPRSGRVRPRPDATEESMADLTRRTIMRSLAAVSAAAVIGTSGRSRAAEFSLKYGNNLPLSHPLNVRAHQAADRIAAETKGRVEVRIFPNN